MNDRTLIDSLRTGHALTDVLVAFAAGCALKIVFDADRDVDWTSYVSSKFWYERRVVDVRRPLKTWREEEREKREHSNHVLQRAIRSYFSANVRVVPDRAEIRFETDGVGSECRVRRIPVDDAWAWFDDDVQIRISEKSEKFRDSEKVTTVVCVRSRTSAKRCDDFVDAAAKWYADESERRRRRSHAFELIDVDKMSFSTCPIRPRKTLETLFVPFVDVLRKRLDDFVEGKGKYALPGTKRHLNVLLHGPPGTGKTSTLEAIVHRLGRHVVNVRLAEISTSQDLVNLMFRPTFEADGISVPVSEVVFVFEDVDADSDVVKRRDDVVVEDAYSDDDDDSSIGKRTRDGKFTKIPRKRPSLTLATVLNVFDGIVKIDGGVALFTTNRYGVLDPAFRRPGRMDLTFEVGFAEPPEIDRLVRHYYGVDRDSSSWASWKKLTMAALESVAMDCDDPDDFVERCRSLPSSS